MCTKSHAILESKKKIALSLRLLLRIASVAVAAAGRWHTPAMGRLTSSGSSGRPKMPPDFKDFEPSLKAPPSSSTEGGTGQGSIPQSRPI
uniref:Uncharacterized protein n=1 Tax=Rhipicephalus zambeziensis TaxID=60191 RepID=A0A224Y7A0_9ACAR